MSTGKTLDAAIIGLTAAACLVGHVGPARAAGVSPGVLDRVAVTEQRCPTFSWEAVDRASLHELVVYALPQYLDDAAALTVDLREAAEVLYTTVPGRATTWTPSAEQCLEPGARYVWFVRAAYEVADGEVVEAGEWSAGRYFAVPAAPSAEELARALEVLQRYAEHGGELGSGARAALSAATTAAGRSGTGGTPKSVPTGEAAIRGVHPGTAGETYGVVGISSSWYGAGVAAANLGSGPDLVLDGSADGLADTLINEGVLDRPSPADQVFLFHNSGGGALDLHVHGTLNGDGLNVQYGPVIDDQGHWLGVGDTVPCSSCVTSADIADGSIIDNDLAAEAVTEAKIEPGAVSSAHLQAGAVTSNKILDGTITAADLADGSVASAEIADGAITTADLAGGAVTSIKIADAAVGSAQLAANAVASSKIADGTITAADLAPDAVTGAEIADGTITSSDLAAGSVTGTQIADGSVASGHLRSNVVTNLHLADDAVGSAEIVDGSVAAPDLAAGAVTSATILDGAITGADIGAGEVTTSHLMNMSVTGSKLSTGAVTSTKVADGTLTALDVDPAGGIYASKASLYSQTGTTSIVPGSCATVHASCNDANDLPLEGGCGLAAGMPMKTRDLTPLHWDDPANPARWQCESCLEPGPYGTLNVTATIVCLTVPGP